MSDEDAPRTGRPARDPLAVQSTRVANRVHDALRSWGRPELAARVRDEAAQWSDQQLVVVTAGDIKRGKSSLLNALLDRESLLPVDADVATSVHLVVAHGTEQRIQVTRIGPDGEPTVEEVSEDDLVDVASMRGDPTRREGVTSVRIELDHPLLERGVVLIDTPGVGGMTRGHRDLALAALGRADALIFTVSAQEPIARSELEFLVEATARNRHVLLVVTKADVNTDDVTAAMLDEHRRALRTFADDLARARSDDGASDEAGTPPTQRMAQIAGSPLLVTSSLLARQARRRREAGRLEQAEQLRARSGVDRLVHVLDRSLDQRTEIRVANLLELLRSLLHEAEREQRGLLRASSGDGGAADDLVALRQAMEQFGSTTARWRTTLANSIVRLQTSSSRLVTRELNRVKEHYREVIENATDVDQLIDALPADIERSLHAAWNELCDAINRDFQSTLGALLEDFGAAGMDAVLGRIDMPETLRELSRSRVNTAGETSLLDDGLPMAMQTYTFANIANAAARVLGVASGGLGLVAYGIGAAVAYPIGKMRKQQRERQRAKVEYQRWIGEVLFGNEGVAKEFTTELSLRILDLREAVERYVEDRLADRRKQLDREHRELQNLVKAEAGQRAEAEQVIVQRLDEIGRLRAEIDPLSRAVEARLGEKSD